MNQNREKFWITFITIIAFICLVGFIIVNTVYEGEFSPSIPSIKTNPQANTLPIKFFSDSNIPDIKLDGKHSEITITLSQKSPFYIDSKEYLLENFENKIIIQDFEGEISLNKNTITVLNGKTSKVILNDLPIRNKDNSFVKISLPFELSYSSFKFAENISIKEINYLATGNLNLENESVSLNNQPIFLKNFKGILRIENKKLFLDGTSTKIEITRNEGKFILP